MVVGCSKSNNLDAETAKPVIQAWIDQQKADVVVSNYDRNACFAGLVASGYITQDFKDTGKAKSVRPMGGIRSITVYKGELLEVSPPRQVEGEKRATVNFRWKYASVSSDVPTICEPNTGYRKKPMDSHAIFELTTNGWDGAVQ